MPSAPLCYRIYPLYFYIATHNRLVLISQNSKGTQFCGDCGQPLRQEVVCLQCGNSNPARKKFCDKCGQALAEHASKKPRHMKPSIIQPASLTCLIPRIPGGKVKYTQSIFSLAKQPLFLSGCGKR